MNVVITENAIWVAADSDSFEDYEKMCVGSVGVMASFRLRTRGGQLTVCEPIDMPDLSAFPRHVVTEAMAAYAQGYIDGLRAPAKPLWQFSSIHMARGPYYDSGVCAGQQAAAQASVDDGLTALEAVQRDHTERRAHDDP